MQTKMKKSDINQMPQYFGRYIEKVDDVELMRAFDESLQQIESLDRDLLAKIGDESYAPGKWTIKEIFQHIIDWERIFAQRTLLFARNTSAAAQAIDENLLAKNMNANRRKIEDLIEELKIARLSTKALFESFDDQMLSNTGKNWNDEMSVLAMGFTIIGHQKHHFKIIEEKYYALADKNL